MRANIIKLIAELESSQIANEVSVRGVQLFLDEISEGVRDEVVRADVLAESQQVAADAQDTAGVEVVPAAANVDIDLVDNVVVQPTPTQIQVQEIQVQGTGTVFQEVPQNLLL